MDVKETVTKNESQLLVWNILQSYAFLHGELLKDTTPNLREKFWSHDQESETRRSDIKKTGKFNGWTIKKETEEVHKAQISNPELCKCQRLRNGVIEKDNRKKEDLTS